MPAIIIARPGGGDHGDPLEPRRARLGEGRLDQPPAQSLVLGAPVRPVFQRQRRAVDLHLPDDRLSVDLVEGGRGVGQREAQEPRQLVVWCYPREKMLNSKIRLENQIT